MQPQIKDYKITDKLAESRYTLVCRAYRTTNGESVVLKIMKPDAITKDGLARFRREFKITSRLNLSGVVKALALKDYNESLAIIYQDIGGQSLDRILDQAPLSLTDSLELATTLADTVGRLHKRKVIHKNINPSHIIVNPTTRQVSLIGFGLADELPERSVTSLPPSALAGTLAYISPEQTGRMNRPVDYRTDFYSLGVTFYRMLTGKLPFEADDALGIVHSHIARTPVPPHKLDPDIPDMVSLIVMKLMSKMADDRYQSAFGLKSDWEKCLRGLRDEGVVRGFEPGLEDFSDQLRFPVKLYGREGELDLLYRAFERVRNGKPELLLIAGYAGVGKTRLAREIHKTVIEKQGYFIEGKLDQSRQDVPYSAWIEALDGFVKYILMESEAGLAQWKENILSALGGIGKVLTDVIPNLELVIGTQPDVILLGPLEAQNRFNYVFLKFIKTVATSEHPLAVFLDDLQWIDGASLNLLKTLVSTTGVSNILVIGAYRDNEVDSFHSLMKTIEALRNEAARVDLLELKDLSETTTNELIADIVHRTTAETIELTQPVYFKTGGNPFFLRQTFKTMLEKQAVFYDTKSGQWKWDISILNGIDITDNMVDFLLGKIRLLPSETQRILPLATCIGYTFDSANLGIIAEQPEDAVVDELQPALCEGLVVPLGDEFQFAHDRVQEAAYTLIPVKEKKQVHLKLGRLLLKYIHENDQEEQLFTAVEHLNIGAEFLKERNDKLELARLNLRAGLKARASGAFSAADKYFETGVALLDKESWETDYGLTLELNTRAAETASLFGAFEKTDQLFDVITDNSKNVVDTVGAYESRINGYISQGDLQQALDCALEILIKLGMNLPSRPDEDDIAAAANEAASLYANRAIEDLINLPKANAPDILAIIHILVLANASAYSGRPPLYMLLILTQFSMNIKHGTTVETPLIYACYALYLCGIMRDFDSGYRFAKLALTHLEAEKGNLPTTCGTLDVIGGFVWHFKEHLNATLPYLEAGYRIALEVGNPEMAGNCGYFICQYSYLAGMELHQVEQVMDFYGEELKRIRGEVGRRALGPYRQAIKNLLTPSGNPCAFTGQYFDQEMLAVMEQTKFIGGLAAFYVNRLILSFLFEDYDQAFESAELMKKNKDGMLGMFSHSTSMFYDSLTRIQIYPHKEASEQAQILERVSSNQQEMKHLADSAPMNNLHKFFLVEAERMRLAGAGMATLDTYDQAISLAGEHGYIQEEALSNELASRFCLRKGKEEFARVYMKKAYYCYESWGAVRKVQDLEERYGYLLKVSPSVEKAEIALELLDLSTLMKATHAISSEIEMDKLLDQVMHIIVENAGAESGFLLLEHDGVWQITAKGGTSAAGLQIHIPVSIEESDVVARSVVRFVAHTKESIVLDDAANKGDFRSDSYIKKEKTRSLFCAPLLSLGRLIGILYLENNLTTQAFTEERIQILEMLLSQTAISLENARNYKALKESEKNLRDNEERMQLALKGANIGFFDFNIQENTLLVDDGWLEMLGYSPDEIKIDVDTWWSWVHPDDQIKSAEAFQDHVEGRSQYYHVDEYRARGKSGDWVWLLDHGKVVEYDSDGKPLRLVGIHMDITEHKKIEQERLAYLRFLECMDKINRAIQGANDLEKMMSDVLGLVLSIFECDRAFLMYPCDPGAAAWRVPMERNKPEYPGALELGFEIPMDENVADTLRLLLAADGPVKFGPGTPHPLPADAAEQFGFKCFMSMALHPKIGKPWEFGIHQCSFSRQWTPDEERLFTEIGRRLADGLTSLLVSRNLQESENRYRRITEGLTDYQYSVRIEDGRVVETTQSQACETVTGYTPEEFTADPHLWFKMIAPEDREPVQERIQQVLAGKEIPPLEHRLIRKDGAIRWVRDTNILFKDDSGKLLGYDGVIKDITRHRQAEEEIHQLNQELEQRVLERTAQLEAANKELEAFAYSVSHDLRSPLRHIDGYLELLKQGIEETLNESSLHYIKTISDSIERMGQLIDDLLSFSRMGRHAVSLIQVDMGILVRDVMRELTPDSAGRTIEWCIGDLPMVEGDATMLRMVLVNLIANAIKFTRVRQQARIEVGSLPGETSETVIFVRDNGVGFDMTYAEKLFGVFQRLHRSDEFEGTGIGLANVYRIIDRHGGRTWAQGEPGKGAVFYFSLPHRLQRGGNEKP